MDGEAGWWTTSGNIGLPPLARVMGVGRQQQHQHNEVLTYALLNTKSDTTFILDEVADDLVMSNYEEVQLESITIQNN